MSRESSKLASACLVEPDPLIGTDKQGFDRLPPGLGVAQFRVGDLGAVPGKAVRRNGRS